MPAPEKFDAISAELERHYSSTFKTHGATSQGVDWGPEERALMRYDKMLEVIPTSLWESDTPVQLLDVGCGFGGLMRRAVEQGLALDYTGLDVSLPMIEKGRELFPQAQWAVGDVLRWGAEEQYDFVVCNGILTQKLDTPFEDMLAYSNAVIEKLYLLCRKGTAFNIMTTHVNFQVDNLFYRNPTELMGYCLHKLTRKVRIDHSYPLYEYTTYLYK